MESIKTKKCSKCGRELPISEFYRNSSSKDGLQGWCKDCTNDKLRKQGLNPVDKTLDKILDVRNTKDSGSPLKDFTPRELINELRQRGYTGKLQIVHTITV